MRDQTLFFSEKQEVTSSAASDNILEVKGDYWHGLHAVAQVATAFEGATSVTIELQTADKSDFSDQKTLFSLKYALSDLVAGKTLCKVCVPLGVKKYLRGYYTVEGAGSAGALDFFLMDNPGSNL